ncbi:helix-turn-helix domain-containing protein [Pedobacter metabolipauper]|uniref:AraC-like DNA-binding protein n=1 Tax=Pedobacter metabolipauper TaxID=425513 RepID=A0A4R6T094_9SPHI|nr:helix-turn-helix domain-containing protein [Pedobacter metabolipauper]TDQ11787.1 AraC-like DNA-binding protein [Pedobacter metabolipauper]
MKRSSQIPTHTLQERGVAAFEIHEIKEIDLEGNVINHAHRDDNYIFFWQKTGRSKLIIDFQEIEASGSAILCIIPGQVHHGIYAIGTTAWFLAVDTSWVLDSFRSVFDGSTRNQAIPLDTSKARLFEESLQLLSALYESKQDYFNDQTRRSMLDVCISLFAVAYEQGEPPQPKAELRSTSITRQFKSMLLSRFRVIKSPSAYASLLNISSSYLNEVVKDTTGHPVSYWIHHEIILEAKRRLFYTDNTVKEISHDLGYQDTTYFIRLFGKTTGMSPLQFRQEYRK